MKNIWGDNEGETFIDIREQGDLGREVYRRTQDAD